MLIGVDFMLKKISVKNFKNFKEKNNFRFL